MKFLLTGGAGYLGSVLSQLLLDCGHEVTALDDLSRCRTSPLHLIGRPGYRLVRGDAGNPSSKNALGILMSGYDVVVPLAAVVGQAACDADPGKAERVNLGAITQLRWLRDAMIAETGEKPPRVVFPATNSGYGTKSGEILCDESTKLEPISHYGVTKVAAENVVLRMTDAVSLRFATLFGPSPAMRWDLLVNYFVGEAVTRKAIVVFEGRFVRNYLHVRDAARAILHAAVNASRVPDGAYNVGLTAGFSKLELARIVGEAMGAYVHEAPVGSDPDKRNYLVSTEKFEATGFRTSVTVREGIEELKMAALTMGGS